MDGRGDHGAADIVRRLGIAHDVDAPLGPLTWYKVGGAADVLARPHDVEHLASLMRGCHDANVPVHVLGRGANLLVCDEGVRGVVIQLTAPALRRIQLNGTQATAGGGADLARLIMTCVRGGCAGLEGLAGVPATVGGALRMNAGGHHATISDTLVSVTTLDQAGELHERARRDIAFAYRSSDIADPIIVEAKFVLQPDDPAVLRQRVKAIFAEKRASQPLADKSAGCAFKNPPADVSDRPAGQLIDEAGLKGLRIGGAEVSGRHANFIVVHSGGTANDVLAVMTHVQRTVAERFSIELEREVVVWGQS